MKVYRFEKVSGECRLMCWSEKCAVLCAVCWRLRRRSMLLAWGQVGVMFRFSQAGKQLTPRALPHSDAHCSCGPSCISDAGSQVFLVEMNNADFLRPRDCFPRSHSSFEEVGGLNLVTALPAPTLAVSWGVRASTCWLAVESSEVFWSPKATPRFSSRPLTKATRTASCDVRAARRAGRAPASSSHAPTGLCLQPGVRPLTHREAPLSAPFTQHLGRRCL